MIEFSDEEGIQALIFLEWIAGKERTKIQAEEIWITLTHTQKEETIVAYRLLKTTHKRIKSDL